MELAYLISGIVGILLALLSTWLIGYRVGVSKGVQTAASIVNSASDKLNNKNQLDVPIHALGKVLATLCQKLKENGKPEQAINLSQLYLSLVTLKDTPDVIGAIKEIQRFLHENEAHKYNIPVDISSIFDNI